MSNCLQCSTQIPDSAFGIYTCKLCGAVLSIDFEGKAQMQREANLGDPGSTNALNLASGEKEPYQFKTNPGVTSAPNFEDVVSFANSEISQLSEGPFLYDLLISGVDSEDLRKNLQEALSDKKFGWKPDEMIARLRSGSLLIERINAVKASVLVNRLKGSALEISWRQNGILQMDPEA